MNIQKELFKCQDLKYKDFSKKLINTVDENKIIGVRSPDLKRIAKDIIKENKYDVFLNDLPHKYFEEDQLHVLIISSIKDFDLCVKELDRFLPFMESWATTDSLKPKTFKQNKEKAIKAIYRWLKSKETYTIRVGVSMLMTYYLDEDFKKEYLLKVAKIKSKEYYVNMMRAWYFATSLVKQYDETIKYLEEYKLDTWTHNKTIQKARESYRISDETKAYLNTLKVKG